MKKFALFIILSIFLIAETQAQCTPVDCRPEVTLPTYGGVCSETLPQGVVNQLVDEEVTIVIGGACFNTTEIDPTINLGEVRITSVFGFAFSGLPADITVTPNQNSYNPTGGNDVLGCIEIDGTPTEAGVFSAGINFTVRVQTFPFGCPVNILSLFPTLPFDFALDLVVLPDPTFVGLASEYCQSDGPATLTATGTQGGTFSGPGVVGTTFDPALAGPGIHEVVYFVSAQEGLATAPAQNSSSQFVEVLPSVIYYADTDEDTYGDPNNSTETCDPAPEGYVENSDDCDDTNEFINPDADEVCDGEDNDCDGNVDGDDDETLQAFCQDITVELGLGGFAFLSGSSDLANSSNEFSGTQGENDWQYGQHFAFDSPGFTPLPTWTGFVWAGNQAFDTPFLDALGGHPGVDDLQWAVRRWTSSFAGPATISGDFFDRDLNCGDGAHVRIFQNGVQVYEFLNITNSSTPYSFDITLVIGDAIDFAIDPIFDGGCDDTHFTAVISTTSSVNAGSLDACGTAVFSVSPSGFTCSDLGPNPVTLTLTAGENISSCDATVTVVDSAPDWVLGEFGDCSEPCGGGVQTRTVDCQDCNGNVLPDGSCPQPKPETTQNCNEDPCCEADWIVGEFGECSEPCGDGIQIRTVECRDCTGNLLPDGSCPQPKPDTEQACNLGPCAIDCVVSEWSDWSECTVTCGGGTQFRTRTVLVEPQFGGEPCPVLEEVRACNEQPCPIDCEVSEWSEWSECSLPCGGGTQTRTRTILVEPQFGGEPCPVLEETRPCNTDPCPIDCVVSEWSEWSECTVTCGGGTQVRTRTVLVEPQFGGEPCPVIEEVRSCNTDPCCESDWFIGEFGECSEPCGDGVQIRIVECRDCEGNVVSDGNCPQPKPDTEQACNLGPCPIDCIVSEWSDWSECSLPCGGGTQTRTRTILVQPQFGGEPCPVLEEVRACNEQPCPIDCEVSEWSDWSECTVTCGGGTQFRTRTVLVEPQFGGEPCPVLLEERSCNTDPCPIDCEVSEWSEWSECTVTCGGGTQFRTRTVLVEPQFGGEPCPVLEETRPCNTDPCPIDCEVSEWSDWSECTVTCGGGTQIRTRTVLVEPQFGGEPCPVLVEERPCNEDPCCESDWVVGEFGECSEICGDGVQIRTVECVDCAGNVLPDGNCPQPKPDTEQACNLGPCPIDCVVSEWSDWSECTVTCGGGTQFRTRTVLVEPQFGGEPCPLLEEVRSCNEQPCPIDCVVSEWSEWSECTVTCGGGTQFRTRTVLVEPQFGGEPCPVLEEVRSCNEQPCPIDCEVGPWSDWSECTVTCGGGIQTRTREILVQPAFGGEPCPPLVETRPCNEEPCSDDCDTPENLYATDITFFRATLGWDAVPDAIRYQAEGRIKNSPFGLTKRRIVTTNEFRTNNLIPFLTYQFRVRTDCPETGWSAWSDWFDFTLNPFLYFNDDLPESTSRDIPVLDLFDTEKVFNFFPNPTAGILKMQYMGEELKGAELSIIDLSGRYVHYETLDWMPGEQKEIDLGEFDNGMYVINLVKDGIPLRTEKVFLSK